MDLLKSFAVVTRHTAIIKDRSLRVAVSHIVEDAPHNGTYGFLAASDDVQGLQDKMSLYTVRDALKSIHGQIN